MKDGWRAHQRVAYDGEAKNLTVALSYGDAAAARRIPCSGVLWFVSQWRKAGELADGDIFDKMGYDELADEEFFVESGPRRFRSGFAVASPPSTVAGGGAVLALVLLLVLLAAAEWWRRRSPSPSGGGGGSGRRPRRWRRGYGESEAAAPCSRSSSSSFSSPSRHGAGEGHRLPPRVQQEYDVTSATATGPCDAYLVFRCSPPLYASAISISNLLKITATAVTESNAVDPVTPVAADPLVLAPVVGDLIPTRRLACPRGEGERGGRERRGKRRRV
uniref:NFP/LYK4/5 first LysM domain-containing protein n=1 Tax=Oryza glaberrima TaxID=4538 RepID=I1P0V0_ORYGL